MNVNDVRKEINMTLDYRDSLTVNVDGTEFSRKEIQTIHQGFIENETKDGIGYVLEMDSKQFDTLYDVLNEYLEMNQNESRPEVKRFLNVVKTIQKKMNKV